jgi:glycogen debranching enzyme
MALAPNEIFDLIIKADEKLKYANDQNRPVRERQAKELLVQALEAAREARNEALIAQAEQRLSDLGMPPIQGGAGERRPTPLDPYPELRTPSEQDAGDAKSYPPELGTDAIAILEGRTFMFSDSLGDVPAGSIGGLLHEDTRFVSGWRLTIDDEPLSLLKSKAVDYYSAAFFLTNADLPSIRANTLSVRRLRFVGGGVHEQIAVYNASNGPVRFRLRLEVGADFADLFEVKSRVRDRSAYIDVEHDEQEGSLHFHYERDGFLAETNVAAVHGRIVEGIDALGASTPLGVEVDGDSLLWDLELPSRHSFVGVVRVTVRKNDAVLEPMHQEFGEQQHHAEGALTSWLDEVPRFTTDDPTLKGVFDRSIVDLAALRISGELNGEPYVLPAAGLPWFMTLFGRDTLITSLQTLWVGPDLARGALHLLGSMQGTEVNDFKDEEPGKILHEIRDGELTARGEKPHSPYYGTCDATPLWLVLMSEYWRFSGDDDFVRSRWDKVLAALAWCDTYGDRDGDGFIEYATRSSQGLGNQGWKDSWDGVQFADGSIPFLPIATAEIQGYAYDAKRRAAEMAERLMADAETAARLRKQADDLHDRFNRAFWSEDRGGYYVIGLDGDKRQIDTITSNMGHLLWSGIVPEDRAPLVRDQLLSDRMFSGWGIRTLSSEEGGYNPIGYHTGTIWPHDNSIAAWGLERYGFRDEANRIAMAQLKAAAASEFRLPEAFAGFDGQLSRFPVPYPTACSPQAWATGAPFVFLKTMFGLSVEGGAVSIDPRVPEELGRVFVHGMHAFGTHWDLEATGSKGEVRLTH